MEENERKRKSLKENERRQKTNTRKYKKMKEMREKEISATQTQRGPTQIRTVLNPGRPHRDFAQYPFRDYILIEEVFRI